jgi:hypothetical protein
MRRSVNRGDLVLCNMDGTRVESFEAAAAPPGDGEGYPKEVVVKPSADQLAELDKSRKGGR